MFSSLSHMVQRYFAQCRSRRRSVRRSIMHLLIPDSARARRKVSGHSTRSQSTSRPPRRNTSMSAPSWSSTQKPGWVRRLHPLSLNTVGRSDGSTTTGRKPVSTGRAVAVQAGCVGNRKLRRQEVVQEEPTRARTWFSGSGNRGAHLQLKTGPLEQRGKKFKAYRRPSLVSDST